MPGFDSTGPQGQGPMTGRKMGNCISSENANTEQSMAAGSGMGMGRGLRCGRGRGNGNGRGFRNRVSTTDVSGAAGNDQMIQMQARIEQLESELTALRQQNEDSDNQR